MLYRRELRKVVCAFICLMFFFSTISYQLATAATNSPNTRLEFGKKLLTIGSKYIGVPYQYGADPNQTRSFDCSSFTKRVFMEAGITLPRVTTQQIQVGKSVSVKELQVGDLLFYQDPSSPGVTSHVAIYAGGNQMLHASTSKGVMYADMTTSYWTSRFLGAKRIVPTLYKVDSGDTLWKIYNKTGVTIDQLRSWNRLNGDMILVGQMLFLANPDYTSSKLLTTSSKTYTVQSGDTLWIISQKTGVSVNNIKSWNGLHTDMIYVGQKLIIPYR